MTGIICAMQIEANGIIALSQNTQTEEIAGMKFTTGTLNGKDIAVVVCGVGKVNAAMCAVVLIEKFNPDVVINSGVGGSLSPLVSMGGESVRKILGDTKPKTIGMFIGSEGGFEQSEVDSVTAIGGQAATLGKRILRAETAPLAALSIIMYETDNF